MEAILKLDRRHFLLAISGGAAALAGCRNNGVPPPVPPGSFPVVSIVDPQKAASSPQLTRSSLHFTDVTTAAGLHWTYSNGATGKHLFIETAGGGVAFFDYNNDGLLDIFVCQGGPVPGANTAQEKSFPIQNSLYRNNGDGTFTDVTAGSGLDTYTGYGQGVSIADFNNDGWADIYITAYGGNRLFRNNGNGTFTDVTNPAGVADVAAEFPWPLSSAWGDYDNDGHLDLFVCHYVRWSLALDKNCPGLNHKLLYCRPQVYEPSICRLYHNNGNGTFTDVTHKAGLNRLQGKSMGAAWMDYDDDGWIDLFVTNDTMPNFLLHNNRDGTFTEVGTLAGVAVGTDGQPQSGMGIGVGDYNNDGREDLFAVNFQGQPKAVYQNAGHGVFINAAYSSNIASTNLQFLGFGMEAFDYDLDGYKDLIIGNGHVLDRSEADSNGSTYAQSQQLLHNQGNGTFTDDLRSLGDLVKPRVTRGLAIGDYDNDGDLDVVMVGQNEPLQLFRNDGGNINHWITFRLEGVHINRDAIGAKVTIRTGKGEQTQWVRGGSSFCSHSDIRVTFGLAEFAEIERLTIRWKKGVEQSFGKMRSNMFYWIREGGQPLPDPRIK